MDLSFFSNSTFGQFVRHMLLNGTLQDHTVLQKRLRIVLEDVTFLDAYNKSGAQMAPGSTADAQSCMPSEQDAPGGGTLLPSNSICGDVQVLAEGSVDLKWLGDLVIMIPMLLQGSLLRQHSNCLNVLSTASSDELLLT